MSDDAPASRPRRRIWPGIAGLLLLVALVGGFIFWLVKPETTSAIALFEVRMESPSILGDQDARQGREGNNYEIFRKTQVALLKSKFLLTAALRNPRVAGSPVFAGVNDPEAWLMDHLEVGYPQDGEILEIKLRGPATHANDLVVVVDAVVEAYKKEVLAFETSRKLNIRDMLDRSLHNLNAEIKRKYEDYLDITKGMGREEGSGAIQQQLDMKRMDRIEDELAQLEREQLQIESGGDGKDSKFIAARMEHLRKRQSELEKKILKRSETSVDLESRGEELKQLQEIANDMNVKLEKLDIDSQSPGRIRQVQAAIIESGKMAVQ